MPDVAHRLRRVDRRISQIDRRLGFLSAHLFFKPAGATDYAEVGIFDHADNGVTPKNWKTGVEIEAHRHTFKVDRDWWDAQNAQYGSYAIQLESGDRLACELESQSAAEDGDTFVTIVLRVTQSTYTYQ